MSDDTVQNRTWAWSRKTSDLLMLQHVDKRCKESTLERIEENKKAPDRPSFSKVKVELKPMDRQLSLIDFDLDSVPAFSISQQKWPPFKWKPSPDPQTPTSNFELSDLLDSARTKKKFSHARERRKENLESLCIGHQETNYKLDVLKEFNWMKNEYILKRCSAKKLQQTFYSRLTQQGMELRNITSEREEWGALLLRLKTSPELLVELVKSTSSLKSGKELIEIICFSLFCNHFDRADRQQLVHFVAALIKVEGKNFAFDSFLRENTNGTRALACLARKHCTREQLRDILKEPLEKLREISKESCLEINTKKIFQKINLDTPIAPKKGEPAFIEQVKGKVKKNFTKVIELVDTFFKALFLSPPSPEVQVISKVIANIARQQTPNDQQRIYGLIGAFVFLRLVNPFLLSVVEESSLDKEENNFLVNLRRNVTVIIQIIQQISNQKSKSVRWKPLEHYFKVRCQDVAKYFEKLIEIPEDIVQEDVGQAEVVYIQMKHLKVIWDALKRARSKGGSFELENLCIPKELSMSPDRAADKPISQSFISIRLERETLLPEIQNNFFSSSHSSTKREFYGKDQIMGLLSDILTNTDVILEPGDYASKKEELLALLKNEKFNWSNDQKRSVAVELIAKRNEFEINDILCCLYDEFKTEERECTWIANEDYYLQDQISRLNERTTKVSKKWESATKFLENTKVAGKDSVFTVVLQISDPSDLLDTDFLGDVASSRGLVGSLLSCMIKDVGENLRALFQEGNGIAIKEIRQIRTKGKSRLEIGEHYFDSPNCSIGKLWMGFPDTLANYRNNVENITIIAKQFLDDIVSLCIKPDNSVAFTNIDHSRSDWSGRREQFNLNQLFDEVKLDKQDDKDWILKHTTNMVMHVKNLLEVDLLLSVLRYYDYANRNMMKDKTRELLLKTAMDRLKPMKRAFIPKDLLQHWQQLQEKKWMRVISRMSCVFPDEVLRNFSINYIDNTREAVFSMLFFRFDRGEDLGAKNRISRLGSVRNQLSKSSINIFRGHLEIMTNLLPNEKHSALVEYILWSLEHSLRFISWVGIKNESCNDLDKEKLSLFKKEIEPRLKKIGAIKAPNSMSAKRRFFNTLTVHAPDEYYEKHGQTWVEKHLLDFRTKDWDGYADVLHFLRGGGVDFDYPDFHNFSDRIERAYGFPGRRIDLKILQNIKSKVFEVFYKIRGNRDAKCLKILELIVVQFACHDVEFGFTAAKELISIELHGRDHHKDEIYLVGARALGYMVNIESGFLEFVKRNTKNKKDEDRIVELHKNQRIQLSKEFEALLSHAVSECRSSIFGNRRGESISETKTHFEDDEEDSLTLYINGIASISPSGNATQFPALNSRDLQTKLLIAVLKLYPSIISGKILYASDQNCGPQGLFLGKLMVHPNRGIARRAFLQLREAVQIAHIRTQVMECLIILLRHPDYHDTDALPHLLERTIELLTVFRTKIEMEEEERRTAHKTSTSIDEQKHITEFKDDDYPDWLSKVLHKADGLCLVYICHPDKRVREMAFKFLKENHLLNELYTRITYTSGANMRDLLYQTSVLKRALEEGLGKTVYGVIVREGENLTRKGLEAWDGSLGGFKLKPNSDCTENNFPINTRCAEFCNGVTQQDSLAPHLVCSLGTQCAQEKFSLTLEQTRKVLKGLLENIPNNALSVSIHSHNSEGVGLNVTAEKWRNYQSLYMAVLGEGLPDPLLEYESYVKKVKRMNTESSQIFRHTPIKSQKSSSSGTSRIFGMSGIHRQDTETRERLKSINYMSGACNKETSFRNHIQNLYDVLLLENIKAQELLIFAFSKISWEYASALILGIWNWYSELLMLKKKDAKKALPTILKAIRVISEGSWFEAAILHGGPERLEELIILFRGLQSQIFSREKISKPKWYESQCDALALMANVFKALCKIGCREEEQRGSFWNIPKVNDISSRFSILLAEPLKNPISVDPTPEVIALDVKKRQEFFRWVLCFFCQEHSLKLVPSSDEEKNKRHRYSQVAKEQCLKCLQYLVGLGKVISDENATDSIRDRVEAHTPRDNSRDNSVVATLKNSFKRKSSVDKQSTGNEYDISIRNKVKILNILTREESETGRTMGLSNILNLHFEMLLPFFLEQAFNRNQENSLTYFQVIVIVFRRTAKRRGADTWLKTNPRRYVEIMKTHRGWGFLRTVKKNIGKLIFLALFMMRKRNSPDIIMDSFDLLLALSDLVDTEFAELVSKKKYAIESRMSVWTKQAAVSLSELFSRLHPSITVDVIKCALKIEPEHWDWIAVFIKPWFEVIKISSKSDQNESNGETENNNQESIWYADKLSEAKMQDGVDIKRLPSSWNPMSKHNTLSILNKLWWLTKKGLSKFWCAMLLDLWSLLALSNFPASTQTVLEYILEQPLKEADESQKTLECSKNIVVALYYARGISESTGDDIGPDDIPNFCGEISRKGVREFIVLFMMRMIWRVLQPVADNDASKGQARLRTNRLLSMLEQSYFEEERSTESETMKATLWTREYTQEYEEEIRQLEEKERREKRLAQKYDRKAREFRQRECLSFDKGTSSASIMLARITTAMLLDIFGLDHSPFLAYFPDILMFCFTFYDRTNFPLPSTYIFQLMVRMLQVLGDTNALNKLSSEEERKFQKALMAENLELIWHCKDNPNQQQLLKQEYLSIDGRTVSIYASTFILHYCRQLEKHNSMNRIGFQSLRWAILSTNQSVTEKVYTIYQSLLTPLNRGTVKVILFALLNSLEHYESSVWNMSKSQLMTESKWDTFRILETLQAVTQKLSDTGEISDYPEIFWTACALIRCDLSYSSQIELYKRALKLLHFIRSYTYLIQPSRSTCQIVARGVSHRFSKSDVLFLDRDTCRNIDMLSSPVDCEDEFKFNRADHVGVDQLPDDFFIYEDEGFLGLQPQLLQGLCRVETATMSLGLLNTLTRCSLDSIVEKGATRHLTTILIFLPVIYTEVSKTSTVRQTGAICSILTNLADVVEPLDDEMSKAFLEFAEAINSHLQEIKNYLDDFIKNICDTVNTHFFPKYAPQANSFLFELLNCNRDDDEFILWRVCVLNCVTYFLENQSLLVRYFQTCLKWAHGSVAKPGRAEIQKAAAQLIPLAIHCLRLNPRGATVEDSNSQDSEASESLLPKYSLKIVVRALRRIIRYG